MKHSNNNGHNASFRPDIEGLRAIAVTMVLAFHLFQTWVPGGFAGVDVFFVISGFLITRQLIKEVSAQGRINIVSFYGRRAKRLLPAAGLVLIATGIASYFVVPESQLRNSAEDIFSAAFYYINWHLAARSVDYLAEGSVPSPVQHFWSLAVEEQYYIVWPLLLTITLVALRRLAKVRTLIWITLAAVAIPSIIYSAWLTPREPGPAYFITTTRMWELAIGAMVAAASGSWMKIPKQLANLVGWCGVGLIIATIALVTTKTPWPGTWAAMPTLGAAAIIVGGFAGTRAGPVVFMGSAAFRWIGSLSYSLYLWHWPLIVLAQTYLGTPSLGLGISCAILVVSVLLSWLTIKVVENPIRFARTMSEYPRYALSVGLNISMAAGVIALALLAFALSPSGSPVASGVAEPVGARILGGRPNTSPARRPVDSVEWFTPTPGTATLDNPGAYRDHCQMPYGQAEPKPCIYGDPNGKTVVAVVGDSKMVQWMPALRRIAERKHWKLVLNGKSACSFTSRELIVHGKRYTDCTAWNRSVQKLLVEQVKPDFLITSGGSGSLSVNKEEVEGFVDQWRPLSNNGTHIIALANNPNPPGVQVYECVEKSRSHLKRCAFKKTNGSGSASLRAATKQLPNARFISLNDFICPGNTCPPIIGNVLIYRQGSHITRTYVLTLTERLEEQLARVGMK